MGRLGAGLPAFFTPLFVGRLLVFFFGAADAVRLLFLADLAADAGLPRLGDELDLAIWFF
jgi:hypothetical protein